jgi:lipooligosaccharide transport system permease protein
MTPPTATKNVATDRPTAPTGVTMSLRALAFWMMAYRRSWRGTAVSSLLTPVAFLAAMGLGLGTLVDGGDGAIPGTDYLEWLAPGLLAGTAMQTAAMETTFSVLGAIKWTRQYHAMLASPLRVVDVVAGHQLFVVFRLASSLLAFLVVAVLFGAIGAGEALLALPVSVLVGMAYATPVFAFAATQEEGSGFAMLYRFAIMPMFLFAGTFFPVEQLPDWLEPVAWLVPLWHGVELCRDIALGTVTATGAALNIGYLALWTGVGFWLAVRSLTRRLVT